MGDVFSTHGRITFVQNYRRKLGEKLHFVEPKRRSKDIIKIVLKHMIKERRLGSSSTGL